MKEEQKMIKIKYEVNGVVEYTTESPVKMLFYEIARTYGERSHENAIKATNLAFNMWLKDDNYTAIGHLADYVAEHYEALEAMSNYRSMLQAFYEE